MSYSFNRELVELRAVFEDLLYYESSLLSASRLEEWTELLHDNIRYWAPVRTNRDVGDEDLARPLLMCHLDEDKAALNMRAARAAGGFGFADNPPARVRHLVTNVRVLAAVQDGAEVTSNVLAWRNHVGLPDHFLVGCRNDRWVREGESWLLIERQVVLDQDVIRGISILL